uniref:Uncharacterized protein n=1 Tax=Thiomonas intermedia (strain K12) TaxID=75379 RepID=D5X1A5_THIK1
MRASPGASETGAGGCAAPRLEMRGLGHPWLPLHSPTIAQQPQGAGRSAAMPLGRARCSGCGGCPFVGRSQTAPPCERHGAPAPCGGAQARAFLSLSFGDLLNCFLHLVFFYCWLHRRRSHRRRKTRLRSRSIRLRCPLMRQSRKVFSRPIGLAGRWVSTSGSGSLRPVADARCAANGLLSAPGGRRARTQLFGSPRPAWQATRPLGGRLVASAGLPGCCAAECRSAGRGPGRLGQHRPRVFL